jgi:hypothetical protein
MLLVLTLPWYSTKAVKEEETEVEKKPVKAKKAAAPKKAKAAKKD